MNSLPKAERLSGINEVQRVFRQGKRFRVNPFQVIYVESTEERPEVLRFGISVSKRISKKAVDRNRIKRCTREAYRTSKAEAIQSLTEQGKHIDFFLVYQGGLEVHTDELREKIILILKRLTAIHGPNTKSADHRSI